MTALILVDIQNDFLPGGALAVPKGDEILVAVEKAIQMHFKLKIASVDDHPKGHISFASTHHKKVGERVVNQILWPDHCIHGTKGAELSVDTAKLDKIVRKGTDPSIDSYSAFYDNHRQKSTGLSEFLKSKGIRRIAIGGLATDYCVLWSVLDALAEGFEVDVIQEACRGINMKEGDVTTAFKQMEKGGARLFPTVTSYRSLI